MIIRKLVAWFELKWEESQIKKATTALDDFAKHADTALKAVSARSIKGFVTNTALAMDELGKSSERLKIPASALEELKYAAEQSGVPLETLDGALKTLHKTALESRWGMVESAQKFRLLGMSATDVEGRLKNPLELLSTLSDRMQAMPNPIKQAWAMDKMFGDEGQTLLPFLQQGSAGIKNLREEARELGVVLDEQAIVRSILFRKALKSMNAAILGLARSMVDNILPALTWALKGMAKATAYLRKLSATASGIRVLKIALVGLGAILAALAVKVLLAFAPLLLMASAVILVVEDLWVAFEDGDAIFKDLYKHAKRFFKPAIDWVSDLHTGIDGFFATFRLGWAALKRLMPDFLTDGLDAKLNLEHNTPSLPKVLAPTPSSINNRSHNVSHQNVNVSVNAKSESSPKDIADKVSQAVRNELEKDRLNTFMGISHYAR
jgi:hypothetical protein